ncbi:N5-glutamine methyltransferase, modifies release factors RF-1 and RF-2 [uncultured delta proteobacterium]|uniref:Release factor glutamine methyltransferase n=1 Tax=uncultured delta proteobacterium TaxID=34034 RepID=A0A212J1D9_9DELT|nr:N5-glutamine methyltransferase, modifies release factors RF-1 and RF-2 [uncultured delta proteobacterium]
MAAMLRALVSRYTERFETAGVDSPRLSAEVLLAHAMGISRADLLKTLILEPETVLSPAVALKAESFAARREKGEPVAYITGVREFYGRDFIVTPATLIPRPDTETVVDAALDFARGGMPPEQQTFIDLGTGSGAIAVTLALELPAWRGLAVDISPDALGVAKRNAAALGAANLDFILCDYLGPALPRGPYGMITANPPYVSEEEYHAVSPEVRCFEPGTALVPPVPGADGLEHLVAILRMAEGLLVPGGLLLMEMGHTQGGALMDAAQAAPAWTDCRVIPDLAGLPRVFRALRG